MGMKVKISFCTALHTKDKCTLIRHVCLKLNCKWKRNPALIAVPLLTTQPLTKTTLPDG